MNLRKAIALLNKARKKPLKFVVWKAAQLGMGKIEKARLQLKPELYSLAKLKLDVRSVGHPDLIRYVERDGFKFFIPISDPDTVKQYATAMNQHYPDSIPKVVQAADSIVDHMFDLLGSGRTVLGDQINWHCDFKTGIEWPPQYHKDIEYNNLDKPSDVKVPWELSRFQHFTALGKAYWYTNDEKYAQEFIGQFKDWLDDNPVGMSVNWSCTMDVALRSINWIWAYRFFASSPSFTAELKIKFIHALANHGAFIIKNLELSDVNGNHYLSDGAGLVYLGLLFRDTKAGQKWLAKGWEIVTEEALKQLFQDGVDFEQSVPYHRLCTELFFYTLLAGEMNGLVVPETVRNRICKALDYVAAYTKPNGEIPLIGDADDGRIHIVADQPLNDHRYLLSTGAVYYNSSELKRASGHYWEESFWLLGEDGFRRYEELPASDRETESQAFPHGGFYIMSTGQSHLIIDCGDVGLAGRGGHGHNDILSFELCSQGETWISDSGAYLYTASPYWRNQFRSSPYHNVLTVDGEELARLGDLQNLWTIRNDAIPIPILWRSDSEYDIFVGSHRGFERLEQPAGHIRSVLFDKQAEQWFILDEVIGQGHRRIHRYLNLHPGVEVNQNGRTMELVGHHHKKLYIHSLHAPPLRTEEGWISKSYGVKEPRLRLIFEEQESLPYANGWVVGPSPVVSEDAIKELIGRYERLLNSYCPKEKRHETSSH